jgi:hypothetical protein
MMPRLAAASRSGHSAARHGAVLVFPPGGGDAHPPVTLSPWRLDEMARADPAARPARGYEQGQPAAWREQDGDEPADRNVGIRQSGEQSGALVTDKTDVDQQSERLYAPLVLPGRWFSGVLHCAPLP